MSEENIIALRMGREELVGLLSILGYQGMWGLGEDYLADFPEEVRGHIVRAGLNALRAKGWVQEGEQNGEVVLNIDSTILALLSTCLSAPRMVYLTSVPRTAPPRVCYVHVGDSLTVIHRTLMPGVHELWATVSADTAVGEMLAFLGMDGEQKTKGAVQVSLPSELLTAVMDLVDEEQEAAGVARLVAEGEMEADTAVELAEALRQRQANSMVALMTQDQTAEAEDASLQPQTSFSFLHSADSLWLLQPHEQDATQLQLSSITVAEGQAKLAALLG